MKDKLPYVFFTQNGKQIGKAISLKENCEYLNPYVQLEHCSLKTNFDSDFQPFIFDVSKYYVSEEFYNDEEFSGTKNQKIE
ncbi:hypothetical protein Mgra_00008651 [Meloidogyne graminicola]|uniref:Uncharacterized protein n=1 Tax=Meloidogyne graminicola TaxID=189291 RepID=A0A8S9ZF86_9BILA|nr:hypothetical protein Mgra_00008651 [Meloidogyne graminicola]